MDESLIREIVSRVLTAATPDRIILFGSAAADRMHRDSDIDLLIVDSALKTNTPSEVKNERLRIDDSLRGLGFPFDVFLIAPDRFEDSKNVFGGIAYPAHKYGRVIYEAS